MSIPHGPVDCATCTNTAQSIDEAVAAGWRRTESLIYCLDCMRADAEHRSYLSDEEVRQFTEPPHLPR